MNILFITDLHIDQDISKTRGIDTKANFIRVLNAGIAQSPDMIVLGGDLCNVYGELDTYRWVKEILDATSIPYHVIPGNHDDSSMISQIFYGKESNESYMSVKSDNEIFLFVDSSKGTMTEEQWRWFSSFEDTDGPLYVFMHHPPVYVGSQHMEPKYSFREINRFEQTIRQFKTKICYVFTGHFHMEASVFDNEKLLVYVTPSTFIQINPLSASLDVIPDRIGYRWIELQNNHLRTSVIYV
jgi:3',5'-cyclic-AMP phosphodiesterase